MEKDAPRLVDLEFRLDGGSCLSAHVSVTRTVEFKSYMNVLFVTHHWPYPLNRFTHGTSVRMRLLLKGLQAAGHSICILAYCPNDQDASADLHSEALLDSFWTDWQVSVRKVFLVRYEPEVRSGGSLRYYTAPVFSVNALSHFGRLAGPQQVASLRSALAESRADFVFAQSLMVMCALWRVGPVLPPLALNLDDIEHIAFARSIPMPPTWRMKRLQWAWLPALKKAERRAVERSEIVFVCSEVERRYLLDQWGYKRAIALPNALPIPECSPVPEEPNVLFVGLQSYDPNRIGAEFFIEKIWPSILAQHPDAQLFIAGRGAEANRFFSKPPAGVRFLGFVEDLSALYARSRLVVCPILNGGGTRIKLVEGALRQRPIVSTTMGAEGLDLDPGQNEIALHDLPEQFASAVNELLGDFEACKLMGNRARVRAELLYGEPAAIDQFVTALKATPLGRTGTPKG